jgi:hypothetical protein
VRRHRQPVRQTLPAHPVQHQAVQHRSVRWHRSPWGSASAIARRSRLAVRRASLRSWARWRSRRDPSTAVHPLEGERHGGPARSCRWGAAATVRLVDGRSCPPRRWPCPCSTEQRPVGRPPRLGRVEIRLGPAWVRYRETATPETDPPSTFHRPVLVPSQHRARFARLRVTLPRCRLCPWCSPAATPTSPTYPARVRLLLPGPRPSVAAIRVRPGACSGIHPCVPHGPAVLHRVAE